jgi:NitT/TauT family transport system substrate-binding protein
MKRRTFAGSLAAFAGAPAFVRAADTFKMIITETEIPLVPNSVEDLALRMGYYKRAGVDVELVRVSQTPSAVAALRSGGGDMANITTDTAIQLVARGQMRLRGVISPDKALPFVIAAKKTIANPKDLEGKSFGVARVGSVDYDMSRIVLAKMGVNPDKLNYLAIGQPPVRAQALLAGQIDATTISVGVWTTMPGRNGLNLMVDQTAFYKAAPFLSKLCVVTDTTAKAKASQVAAVVRAIILASRDFAKNPKLWVDAMAVARPDVKRADLEVLAADYRKSWSVNGGLNLDDLRFTTDTLYRTSPDFKDLPRIEPGQWIDTSFVDEALKGLGNNPNIDVRGR